MLHPQVALSEAMAAPVFETQARLHELELQGRANFKPEAAWLAVSAGSCLVGDGIANSKAVTPAVLPQRGHAVSQCVLACCQYLFTMCFRLLVSHGCLNMLAKVATLRRGPPAIPPRPLIRALRLVCTPLLVFAASTGHG